MGGKGSGKKATKQNEAGRMHTDLRKSMQDSTLEHSILAAFNNP